MMIMAAEEFPKGTDVIFLEIRTKALLDPIRNLVTVALADTAPQALQWTQPGMNDPSNVWLVSVDSTVRRLPCKSARRDG
jgi:hypothetical protein